MWEPYLRALSTTVAAQAQALEEVMMWWVFFHTDDETFAHVCYFASRDVSKATLTDSVWMVPGLFTE